MAILQGIGVSSGIGMAPAFIFKRQEWNIVAGGVDDPALEKQHFSQELTNAIAQVRETQKEAEETGQKEQSEIFEAHAMILEDPELEERVHTFIDKGANAAQAVFTVMGELAAQFESMDDSYFQARAIDMYDLRDQLLHSILHVQDTGLLRMHEECILVAEDLMPSDMARLQKEYVKGIVLQTGGRTSHAAILGRSMEMPMVLGVAGILDAVEEGAMLALDGDAGWVDISPTKEELQRYAELGVVQAERAAMLQKYKGLPTETIDGHRVELACNIGGVADIDAVWENDGEGVGLMRTEFLYLDSPNALPDEDQQFVVYRQIAEGLRGRRAIIRTLDIGGDKKLPALPLPKEDNPFLGYRAIRLCLDRTDIFRTQLRAILRASVYGQLAIMFPMIGNVEQVRMAKSILEQCKDELRAEGQEFKEDMETGIMVEIPAAAVMSDVLAAEVDFFSIGTNDLTQYTLAVDRGNQQIQQLFSARHPAVLRLVQYVIDNGHKHGIWTGMCGEAASDPLLVPLWLGMGLDEFSVSATKVLEVRKSICSWTWEKARENVADVLHKLDVQDVEEALEKWRP